MSRTVMELGWVVWRPRWMPVTTGVSMPLGAVDDMGNRTENQECACSSCSSLAEYEGYCHLCNGEGCR